MRLPFCEPPRQRSYRMIYDGDIVVGQNGKLIAVNERLSFKPLW